MYVCVCVFLHECLKKIMNLQKWTQYIVEFNYVAFSFLSIVVKTNYILKSCVELLKYTLSIQFIHFLTLLCKLFFNMCDKTLSLVYLVCYLGKINQSVNFSFLVIFLDLPQNIIFPISTASVLMRFPCCLFVVVVYNAESNQLLGYYLF